MRHELIGQLVNEEEFNDYVFSPPATTAQLKNIELTLNMKLPSELRSLFEETNGISLTYGRFIW